MNPIMTSEQVANLLQCSPRTVEDKARSGELPAVKFGEGWVFPAVALLEAVNNAARGNLDRVKAKPKRAVLTPKKSTRPTLPEVY